MAWVPAALAAASWAEEQYRKSQEGPGGSAPTATTPSRPISNMMDMPTMEPQQRSPEEQYWRPQPQAQIQMIQPTPLPVREPPAQQMPAEVPNAPLPVTPPQATPQGYWQPRQRQPWEY